MLHLEDVGYLAWTWCVSSNPARGPAEFQAAQLKILADEYGLEPNDRAALVTAMLKRLARNIPFWNERMNYCDIRRTSPAEIQEHIDWTRREMAFTHANRVLFLKILGVESNSVL